MVEVEIPAGGTAAARLRVTERDDGDFAHRVPAGWTWLAQVHGGTVVRVERPGDRAGAAADAAVTETPGAPLAVRTADCLPVVLAADGVVAIAHAGWRGLLAGVLEATVAEMGRPASSLRVVIGPCIRPADYEFGAADLDRVTSALGPSVRARTRWGAPALDLPAAARSVLARLGVTEVEDLGGDTADGDRWFSHRLRAEAQRQATVVSLERV